jgi:hypothetical protein
MNVARVEVDDLHTPSNDNPWFTETAWYSFWDTTGRYIGHIYLRFRPNIGVADCNIYVWSAGSSVPWDAAYWKSLQIPYPGSLADLKFVGGLRHEVTKDFETYRITYHDESPIGSTRLELDLRASGSPHWFGNKHFDQPMLVRGTLALGSEMLDINCHSMRDRSWYNRSDFGTFRSGYSYFLADDEELLVLSAIGRDSDPIVSTLPIVGGYFRQADTEIAVIAGRRLVAQRRVDTGAPDTIVLEVDLADGQRLDVTGRCANSMAIAANTSMLSWMSLVEWERSGSVLTGEDQEIWSPSVWRRFRGRQVGPHELKVASQ